MRIAVRVTEQWRWGYLSGSQNNGDGDICPGVVIIVSTVCPGLRSRTVVND